MLLLATSCEKYLEVKMNNLQTPIKTAEDCQLLLDNYDVMNSGFPSDGQLSADDFYVNPQNMLLENGDQEDRAFYIWSNSAIRLSAQPQWRRTYNIIYYANLVLETVEKLRKDNGASVSILNGLRGAALFYRAYSHWQVAQLYARPYLISTANQDPGIPIRMKSDINEKLSRGTVQETYDQILRDLKESAELLPQSVIVPSRPSSAAAYAMLARVYLSMEDYPRALDNANSALQIKNDLIDYNTLDKNSASPFPKFNKEVIFASIMTGCPLFDPGSDSNPIAIVDQELANSYKDGDLRKVLFLKKNVVSTQTGTIPDGTFRFSGSYDQNNNSSLFNGLVVDEVLLIRSECYARANNLIAAMADLNKLLRTRWVTGLYNDLTVSNIDDALSEILKERRKELLMRGERWTDLRRLNRDVRFAKTLSRMVNGMNYTLSPGDEKYTLLIPNELLSFGIEQNMR